jgi:EmrB/QacA subfamily drug resistance transporter
VLHLKHPYRFHRPAGPGGHENRWVALGAMALSSGTTSIPTSAVVLALPKIHSEFNASQGELQWTLVGFTLAYSVLLIAAGRLSDIFGRRKFFLGGTILYAAAAVGAAIAPDAIILIVMSVIMGVGAAILTPASLSIVTDAFEPAQRGTAIGLWAAGSALVSAVGPALGGVLADWEWRSVFWINVPFAVIFFVMTMFAARESRDPAAERGIDVAGLATLAAGLTTLSLVLNQGQAWGFSSWPSIALFAVSAVLLGAFVLIEPRTRNALVDFGFFRKRNYTGGNAALLVANFILAAVLFFMPLYMEELLHYSPTKAGVLLLPLSATLFVFLPLGGPISERIGPRIPIAAGLVLSAVGGYLFTRVDADSGYNALWPGMLILGAGVGLSLTPLNTAAMNAIRRAEHGAAAGILVTMSGLGATFGIAVSGALFQSIKDHKSDQLLSKIGLNLSDATERTLSGLLAGAKGAMTELKKFTAPQQDAITHADRQGFTDALGSVMWLSVGVTIAGAALVLLVMQRSGTVPDEEEVIELEAEEARA